MMIHKRLTAVTLLALSLSTATVNASADTQAPLQGQSMIQISSDRNSDVIVLSALTDKSSDAKGLNVSVLNNGQVTKQDNFSIAQIAAPNGVVLSSESGLAAVILQGQLDSANGGQARIRYLTNALTQNYAECKTAVRRSKDGQWHVINAYTGQIVTHAFVKTWTMGISAIQGLCPGQHYVTPEEQEAAIREWQERTQR